MKLLSAIPTLDTDAYTAGDACGELLTFDVGPSRTCVIKKAEVLDDGASPVSAAMVLHIFNDGALAVADDAAFSVTQANFTAGKYIGSIAIGSSDYADTPLGDNASAKLASIADVDMFVPTVQGKFYGQLVCTGTPTFAAADELAVLLHVAEYA